MEDSFNAAKDALLKFDAIYRLGSRRSLAQHGVCRGDSLQGTEIQEVPTPAPSVAGRRVDDWCGVIERHCRGGGKAIIGNLIAMLGTSKAQRARYV